MGLSLKLFSSQVRVQSIIFFFICFASQSSFAETLSVSLKSNGQLRPLTNWTWPGDSKLKIQNRKESEITWRGVLFSDFFNRMTEMIPLSEKARIDLFVLRDSKGKQVTVPRAFIQKYPALIGVTTNTDSNKQGLSFVLPQTSHGKQMASEKIPYSQFEISKLQSVEFTSFRELYGENVFLKRRSDPVLLLGEKRFVHTCMSCHYDQKNSPQNFARKISGEEQLRQKHAGLAGYPELPSSDHKALLDFLREIQSENRSIATVQGNP